MENVTIESLACEVYHAKWKDEVSSLILKIQREEFGVPITLEQQPDLLMIETFYQTGNGNFWVALANDKIVGTIALIDIGNKQIALRKMFVAPEYRGKQFATGQLLLDTATAWMREKGCTEVFLGTLDVFVAAQRFYKKNGFEEIRKAELPPSFPAMKLDNTFFRKRLDRMHEVKIVDYRPEHQIWFGRLNRQWIEQYFWMEQRDFDVLQHPEEYVLKTGGAILMAYVGDEVAGTVALKRVKPGVYEFTKMAVAEKFRGQHVGNKLSEATIDKARSLGAYKIILYSNRKLVPAISLYTKLGFTEIPVDGPYERSDIKMELQLIPTHVGAGNFVMRSATEKDAALLCALGIQTFSDSFEADNTAENMRMYLERTFTIEKMIQELREPGTVVMIAQDGDSIAGYVKVRTGHDPKELGNLKSLEIERLYATKTYIGKSAGKFLMESAIGYAVKHGFQQIWLGVWEHNPRAIRYYQKYGFEKFGSHVFAVGTDPQTDLLMKKKLT